MHCIYCVPVGWTSGQAGAGPPEQGSPANINQGPVNKLTSFMRYRPSLRGGGPALPQPVDPPAN